MKEGAHIDEVLITLIAGTGLLLLLVLVVIIATIRYQNRKRRHMLDLERIKNETEREILKARVEEHEETLNWLSKEMHDNIGQLLTSSKMLLGTAERSTTPNEILQLANDTLSRAIAELRAMSKSLNKDWLERFNLIQNLRDEATRINAAKAVVIQVTAPESIALPGDHQLMLFRIIQEAIQNSLKHGQAQEVSIRIDPFGDQVIAIIADNGHGFDVETSRNGLGITTIRQRAEILGGSAAWSSSAEGTRVEIHIPLAAG